MQLNHDWRAFQSTFAPVDESSSILMGNAHSKESPLYVVAEDDVVKTQYSSRENMKDYRGWIVPDVERDLAGIPFLILQRRDVDDWIQGARDFNHYYDQKRYIKETAAQQLQHKVLSQAIQDDHFLLQAIKSWWRRFLPISYGVFIRLEGSSQRDFLLVIRLGAFDLFHEPDLSTLKDRSRQPGEVVRYLSEKHMVPVQGLFVSATDWNRWSKLRDPWRQLASALWSGRMRMTPRPLGLRLLIQLRAWLGI